MPTVSYYRLISGPEEKVKEEVNQLVALGKHKPISMAAASGPDGIRLFVIIETPTVNQS